MTPRTVLRFGEELRRERLVREISLEEISAATKISVRLLKALEESDIKRLPAPAFTRGFIRSYAIHIGIEPEEKVCAYLTDLAEASAGISPSVAKVRPRFFRGRGATAGTIVGGVTAVLLVLGLIARPERRPAARAEKPAARAARVELKNVATSSEPTPAVQQAVQQEEPAAAPVRSRSGGGSARYSSPRIRCRLLDEARRRRGDPVRRPHPQGRNKTLRGSGGISPEPR